MSRSTSLLVFMVDVPLLQEREETVKRDVAALTRAKERLERERASDAEDRNGELRTALRRAETARCAAMILFCFLGGGRGRVGRTVLLLLQA